MRLKRRFAVSDNNIDIINEKAGVKLYKKDKHGKIIREIDLKGAILHYYDPHYA